MQMCVSLRSAPLVSPDRLKRLMTSAVLSSNKIVDKCTMRSAPKKKKKSECLWNIIVFRKLHFRMNAANQCNGLDLNEKRGI